jgi:hypothetical protein
MPRILRSPGSKLFSLENVSVPNADGARCERRRHLRLPKAKSVPGQQATSQACPDMNEAANQGGLRDDRCAGRSERCRTILQHRN